MRTACPEVRPQKPHSVRLGRSSHAALVPTGIAPSNLLSFNASIWAYHVRIDEVEKQRVKPLSQPYRSQRWRLSCDAE